MVAAPFIPAPNVAQVELVFGQNGQVTENVYHVQHATALDAVHLNALALTFNNWWNAHGCACASASTVLNKVRARDLTTAGGLAIERDVVAIQPGLLVGGPLPNNVTIALKWVTGFAGRSQRGRTYLPGLDQSQQDATKQAITLAASNTILTHYQALITAIVADPSDFPVVVSRRHNSLPRVTAQMTPINGCAFADLFLDSQRRRLPAHNIHH